MAAMAPDGKMIAYVTGDDREGMRVFVRDLAEGQAVEILRRRLVTDLVWMPDGSRVIVAGFDKDDRGAWSVPRLGGDAQRLRPSAEVRRRLRDGRARRVGSRAHQHGSAGFPGGHVRRPTAGDRFGWRGFSGCTASTGHRENRIALLTVDANGKSIVWTVSPSGQDFRRLHTSGEPLEGLCSSPDGRTLYTFRHRNDAAELIRLRTDTGNEVQAEVVLSGVRWRVSANSTSGLQCLS